MTRLPSRGGPVGRAGAAAPSWLIGVCCAWAGAAGCSPDPPSAAEARAWYASDRPTIDALSADLVGALQGSRVLARTQIGEAGDLDRAVARDRRLATLRQRTLPRLMRAYPRVVALEIRRVARSPEARSDDTQELLDELLATTGSMPPPFVGEVHRARDGPEIAGRHLGYGVYRIIRGGGPQEVRGYELTWTLQVADHEIRLTCYVTPPAAGG